MASRRATDWIDTLVAEQTATGAQSLSFLMTGVAPVNVRRQTLVRTIIELRAYSSSVAGAWGTQRLSLGIGITSQEAFAAAVVADPNTSNDQPSRGWIFRTQIVLSQNGEGAQVVFDIRGDIRSQRKLDDGECFIVINNTTDLGISFSVNVTGLVRQLWLLP